MGSGCPKAIVPELVGIGATDGGVGLEVGNGTLTSGGLGGGVAGGSSDGNTGWLGGTGVETGGVVATGGSSGGGAMAAVVSGVAVGIAAGVAGVGAGEGTAIGVALDADGDTIGLDTTGGVAACPGGGAVTVIRLLGGNIAGGNTSAPAWAVTTGCRTTEGCLELGET